MDVIKIVGTSVVFSLWGVLIGIGSENERLTAFSVLSLLVEFTALALVFIWL